MDGLWRKVFTHWIWKLKCESGCIFSSQMQETDTWETEAARMWSKQTKLGMLDSCHPSLDTTVLGKSAGVKPGEDPIPVWSVFI